MLSVIAFFRQYAAVNTTTKLTAWMKSNFHIVLPLELKFICMFLCSCAASGNETTVSIIPIELATRWKEGQTKSQIIIIIFPFIWIGCLIFFNNRKCSDKLYVLSSSHKTISRTNRRRARKKIPRRDLCEGSKTRTKNSTSINARRINSRTHQIRRIENEKRRRQTNRLEATAYFTFVWLFSFSFSKA